MIKILELINRWKADPVTFMESLVDPETGQRFRLYDEQKVFIRKALTLDDQGELPYPELLFSAPKKSGKTALAAMIMLYVVFVLGGRYAEGYCCSNDFEQSQGRVFEAVKRILGASRIFHGSYAATANKITFPATGATIQALANDYQGAAGSNPSITCFDELWGYVSESSRRLWDEMVCPPTRKIKCRLTVSYAGFEGESELLEELFKEGKKGDEIAPDLYKTSHMLMYWTHKLLAPWQTESWREQMEKQLRKNAYLRLIENRWVSSETSFIDPEWWQRCINSDHKPIVQDKSLAVWIGVDASVKHDSSAVVGVTWDRKNGRVKLVFHRAFYPSKEQPLDLEETLEETIREAREKYNLKKVFYDPFQFHRSATTLSKEGLPMEEFPQSVPNLTKASQNLFELIKGGNLEAYPDDEMTKAIGQAVAIESARGWKISKNKRSHKIDLVVALAQAALAATTGSKRQMPSNIDIWLERRVNPFIKDISGHSQPF